MALKRWLGASVTSRKLDSEDPPSCLESRLLPEEGNETTNLDKRDDTVVDVDGLLCLGKVCYMALIVHATHVESVTDRYIKITEWIDMSCLLVLL